MQVEDGGPSSDGGAHDLAPGAALHRHYLERPVGIRDVDERDAHLESVGKVAVGVPCLCVAASHAVHHVDILEAGSEVCRREAARHHLHDFLAVQHLPWKQHRRRRQNDLFATPSHTTTDGLVQRDLLGRRIVPVQILFVDGIDNRSVIRVSHESVATPLDALGRLAHSADRGTRAAVQPTERVQLERLHVVTTPRHVRYLGSRQDKARQH
mmetsp:Transcript_20856/g.46709  ORF Transcript_20856/g.46709 Transcript_20856/m.46709 type:complete len:211 (-) Transcript_20856:239-871(-)